MAGRSTRWGATSSGEAAGIRITEQMTLGLQPQQSQRVLFCIYFTLFIDFWVFLYEDPSQGKAVALSGDQFR
jgi:hypothetical protein